MAKNDKRWRPKGWKTLHCDVPFRDDWQTGWEVGREAGADAILEALRKEGWRPEQEYDQIFLSHRAINDMITVGKFRKGAWVFIPDEEEE